MVSAHVNQSHFGGKTRREALSLKKKKAALSSLYQFMINITRLIKVKKEKNNTYILLTLELNVDILGGVHRARIPIYVVRCVENARPLSITGFHDLKKR